MIHGKVKYPPLIMVVLTIRIICDLIAKLTLEIIQIIWVIIIILGNNKRSGNIIETIGGRWPYEEMWSYAHILEDLMKILIH